MVSKHFSLAGLAFLTLTFQLSSQVTSDILDVFIISVCLLPNWHVEIKNHFSKLNFYCSLWLVGYHQYQALSWYQLACTNLCTHKFTSISSFLSLGLMFYGMTMTLLKILQFFVSLTPLQYNNKITKMLWTVYNTFLTLTYTYYESAMCISLVRNFYFVYIIYYSFLCILYNY